MPISILLSLVFLSCGLGRFWRGGWTENFGDENSGEDEQNTKQRTQPSVHFRESWEKEEQTRVARDVVDINLV